MSLEEMLLTIPDWQALPVILGGFIVPALIGFFLVHHLVPLEIRRAHNDVAGFIFSAVGVIYGVLLAFCVVVVWEQFQTTHLNTQHESSAAIALYHAMDTYHADTNHSPDLRPALLRYLQEIVDYEYPAMAALRRLPDSNQALEAIWQDVKGLSPTSPRDQILYGELIGRLNELERWRVRRLDDALDALPRVIWLALLSGAVLTIGFAFFLGTENVRAHAVMVAILAALVGVVFYVIIELDYPFSGTFSSSAEGFQGIIGMITSS